MRSFDLFTERQSVDRSNDANISRNLSREINDLERSKTTAQQNQQAREKVSFASASLCLGSPFMMIGLGAALVEEFSQIRRDRDLANLKNQELKRPLKAAVQALDKKAANSPVEQKVSLTLLSADMIAMRNRSMKKETRADQAVFSDNSRNNRRPYLAPGRDWLEVKRLAKQKQFLKDQMERINKGSSFLAVAQLAAKIELLDKELKRLGC